MAELTRTEIRAIKEQEVYAKFEIALEAAEKHLSVGEISELRKYVDAEFDRLEM